MSFYSPVCGSITPNIGGSITAVSDITDIRSYLHRLQGAIVLSVIVCACIGASNYGLKGVFLGGLLGIAAPAAAIFLAVVLVLAAILLGVYCAAWVAIYYVVCWLLGS
jgi:hypothetical protein